MKIKAYWPLNLQNELCTHMESDTNTAVPGVRPIPSSQTADAVLTGAVRPEGVTA